VLGVVVIVPVRQSKYTAETESLFILLNNNLFFVNQLLQTNLQTNLLSRQRVQTNSVSNLVKYMNLKGIYLKIIP